MDKRERPVSSLRSGSLPCLSDSQYIEKESYPYADRLLLFGSVCIFKIIFSTIDIFSYFLELDDSRGYIS